MKNVLVFCSLFLVTRAYAHVAPTNLNLFMPNSMQTQYTRVEGFETLRPGELSFNLFWDSAFNTFAIYGSSSIKGKDRTDFMQLSASFGLSENLEIGGRFPFLVAQNLSDEQLGYSIQLYQSGFTDSMGYVKYNLFKTPKRGFSLLGQIGKSFSKNVFYDGESSGLHYMLAAVYERIFGSWSVAANAGYVIKNPGERGSSYLYYEPIENSILASIGIGKKINDKHAVSLELIATENSFDIDQSDRDKLSIEGSVAYRRFIKKLTLVAGLGVGMNGGVSEPDVRGFIGMNYKPMPFPEFKLFSQKPKGTPGMAEIHDPAYEDESIVAGAIPPQGDDPAATEDSADPISQDEASAVAATPVIMDESEDEADSAVAAAAAAGIVDESDADDLLGGGAAAVVGGVATDDAQEIDNEENPYQSVYSEVAVIEEDQESGKVLDEFSEENKNSQADFQKIVLHHVEFEFDSYALDEKSVQILTDVASYLKKHEFHSIKILGHTDFYGSILYNEHLSLKRAQAAVNFLKTQGISAKQITYDGYGKRRPLETGFSEKHRKKNRRVEIVIRKK